ncbi:High affinity zinc transporter periplasmic component protein [Pseudescherichia vulneris]|nr:High affinity zinc transporter periplasmic component protein [Pseudescherichia vulneris]
MVWVGPDMEAFMQKPTQQLPAQKQLAIGELPDVKPLLMKGGGA